MRLDIAYGDGYLPIDFDRYNGIQKISPRSTVEISEMQRFVQEAISNTDLFRSVAKFDPERDNIAIVVDNPHRFQCFRQVLEILFNAFRTISFPSRNIHFLLSNSYPSRNELDSIMTIFRDFISEGCELHVHDPLNDSLIRYLGDDPHRSIPVFLNSKYIDSSYKIVLSTIMQSTFTGNTGDLLAIAPGIAGRKTTHQLARLQFKYESSVFSRNPEFQKILSSIANFAPPDMFLNLVQDAYGTIAHIAAGKIDGISKDCVKVASDLASSGIKKRFDIAVVGSGGKGYDASLYDACESLHAGFTATRTGGTILLVAECRNGPGPDGFLEGLNSSKSLQDLNVLAETNFKLGMERASYLRKVMSSRELVICSRLRESLVVEKIGAKAVRDPQEGLDMIVRSNGIDSSVAIINEGPFTNPCAI